MECVVVWRRDLDIEKGTLNGIEMWIWRRMEKVSWKDKVSNEEVLVRIGEKRKLMDTITER